MIQSYRIDVYGIVQGVGFRWFTQQTANKYHLVGGFVIILTALLK